ncbi:MAG: glycosyltransferase family 25 protein [Paracoccaceae bacterium]|nr:glycosyltransferase family 25 protein [Paracoccaceae bacterium]
MISVFVISLSVSEDRRAAITQNLSDLAIPFEFVDGIDGRHGLDPVSEKLVDREAMARSYCRVLNDAEFGCALSHIKAYRTIVDRDLDWALVLEDDATVLEPALEYLNDGHYRLADITQLGYVRAYVRDRTRRALFGRFSAYPKITKASGAFGYVISRRLAKYWSIHALPVVREADWPECGKDFVWDVVHPRLVTHPENADEQSIIGASFDERRRKRLLEKIGLHPRAWPRAWAKMTSRRVP